GRIVMDDSFRELPSMRPREILLQRTRYAVTDHVRFLQLANYIQKMAHVRLAMREAQVRADREGLENLEYAIYRPAANAQMQNAWKVTEGLLVMMRDEVMKHGAAFRLVILPTRPQVIPEPAKRQELMDKLGTVNLSYAEDRLRDFAVQEGIAVADLVPVLSQ